MPTLTRRKVFLIGGVVVLLAVLGSVIAVVLVKTSGSNKANTSASDKGSLTANGSNSTTTTGKPTAKPYIDSSNNSSSGSSSGSGDQGSKITSDPTKAKYTVSAYAVGDWGTTIGRDSCCKRRGDHTPTNVDKNAEDVVAAVMGLAAGQTDLKPSVVMGHGDSFYWVGIIDETDQAYRFGATFEAKFNAPSLDGIPWVNVMGNHDYGGASFICAAGGTWGECKSKEAVIQGLKTKFDLQANYKSPNGNRWIMKDHFYVHSIADKASGVSIDIFNMDTNDADVHGAQQICCQCYSYSGGAKDCNEVTRGDSNCMGGNTDMFDACMDQLNAWGEDSRTQLKEKVAASKATWKIVNTHYSPYNHYAEGRQEMWWDLLKDLGVQLWINGHTHGEKHDYAKLGMHFIENGAGGGILNEAASGIPPYAADNVEQLWAYPTHDYGFFEIKASKEWIKASFMTNDASWSVADDFKSSTIGGVATKHCWYIPVDGSLGKSCDEKTTTSTGNAKVHANTHEKVHANTHDKVHANTHDKVHVHVQALHHKKSHLP